MTADTSFRVERDSMGEMKIKSHYLFGASTQRAVENFQISHLRFGRPFIKALGLIKLCAAEVNFELGKLDKKLKDAITSAAKDVADGTYDDHFVLDIFQTGSGTSTNMNANEVIANLAIRALGGTVGSKTPVHPNDHVNMGQSSNDVIPAAIHISTFDLIDKSLIPALHELAQSLEKKERQFKNIIKTGRTHLQDATPVTLGQEFGGYKQQLLNSVERLKTLYPLLGELAIGGTAVGTGINADKAFGKKMAARLSKELNLPLKEAPNHFEAQASKDTCMQVSGTLKTLAVALIKIANDIRWLASGPRCGLGEIAIPATQPGSSIMPGKVNPVIPESVLQVAAQVIGNDTAIMIGCQAGNFELNVMMPLIARNLTESLEILTNVVTTFKNRCIDGLEANTKRCEETIEKGLSMVTSLAPVIGYDKAAAIAKKAFDTGKTVRELAHEMKVLPNAEIDRLLDPRTMV